MNRHFFFVLGCCLCILKTSSNVSDHTFLDYPFRKDARTGEIVKPGAASISYYSNDNKRKARNLSLYELSDTLYKVAADRNLKIISQKHGPVSSEFDLETGNKGRFTVNVNSFNDEFEFSVSDKDTEAHRKLSVPNRSYMTNEFSTFIRSTVNSLDKRERRLTNGGSNKLEEFCQMLLDVLDAKEKIKGVLTKTSGSDIPCDVYLEKVHLFSVLVKEQAAESSIIITNTPAGDKFADFDMNHFEFRHTLNPNTDPTQLKTYFEHISDDIVEKINHIAAPSENTKLIYNECVNALGEKYNLVQSDMTGAEVDGYISFDINSKENIDFKLAEIQIYPIKHNEVYGLSLCKANKTIDVNFTRNNLVPSVQKALAELVPLINEKMDAHYNFENILNTVKESMRVHNCELKDVQQTGNSDTGSSLVFNSGKLETHDAPSAICVIKPSIIELSLFSYGYLQYLHLTIDNELLRDEFMISVNENFEATLKETFDQVIEVIKGVRENKEKSAETTTIDFESLCEMIKEKMAKYECQLTNEFFECDTKEQGKDIPVLMMNKVAIGRPNESYRVVFLTSRPGASVKKLKTNVKEINIPKEWNSSMIEDLKFDLEEHFENNTGV